MSEAAVEVVTFGCRLNIVESDAMLAQARAAGVTGMTIVNTCAVTAEAARQARQAIRRIARETPGRSIAVTGCAAEIDAQAFLAMPEVTRLIPNALKATAAPWLALAPSGVPSVSRPAPVLGQHTRGFLEIQNGCDHRCTFCVIPFGRGASRSIPSDEVVRRARALVESGAKEIVLTGVDITAYGCDLAERPALGTLVRHLLDALPELPRLRLSSIDCVEADAALFEALASEPRLMPHLHVSLQSGSDMILKRMKRRHSRADAVAFCRRLRALRPEIVLGADIITGFPTETEAMFDDSLALIEDCGLTHLHVFPFSPRPGTPAARMPQVPRDIAKARATRLRAAGEAALAGHLGAQVGRRLVLLTERGGRGRAEDFTAVRLPPDTPPGLLVTARIDGHDGRDLSGTLIDDVADTKARQR